MLLKDMEWKDAKEFIESRLKRLQMCKMGSIATDINKQVADLGLRPALTRGERAKIDKGLPNLIHSKLKITKTDIKNGNCNAYDISNIVQKKLNKILDGIYTHPGERKWDTQKSIIQQQKTAREAQCEADFRDCLDDFILGVKSIRDFPATYDEMEVREW